MNQHIQLAEALNVLTRPTEDDRVEIGLAPVSLSIAMRPGETGTPSTSTPSTS